MQFIEYIESTGTQYIDTGFVPNQDTGFVIDAEVLDTNTSGECHISTVYKSPYYFTFRLNASYNGFACRYGTGKLTAVSYAGEHYARHIFTRSKNTAQVDGATATEFTYETFNVGYNLYIFAGNNGSSAVGYSKLKLYSYKLYDNGVLVRDYRPCVDDAGVVCLYDMVNEAYCYNAGTGEFEAGYAHVFMPRIFEPPSVVKPIAVTITGTGAYSAYAIIDGTTYTTATSDLEVMPGDVIELYVSSSGVVEIYIDNTRVYYDTDTSKTYSWTVPDGISQITIGLSYKVGSSSVEITTS